MRENKIYLIICDEDYIMDEPVYLLSALEVIHENEN